VAEIVSFVESSFFSRQGSRSRPHEITVRQQQTDARQRNQVGQDRFDQVSNGTACVLHFD